MKDVQSDNRKFADDQTVRRSNERGVQNAECRVRFSGFLSTYCVLRFAICWQVVCISAFGTVVYSQSNIVAPMPPMMIPPASTTPGYANPYAQAAMPYGNASYGYSGYGYTVTPATGLYYSGGSPMLQPMVADYRFQTTDFGLQASGNGYEAAPEARSSKPEAYGSGYSQYMPVRSPLLETGWENLKLLSPFNAPDGPHRGVGTPLEDASWLDRPWYVGVFGGWVSGSTLISGQVDQGSGSNGGVALGKNLNHYWGLEGRIFGSSIETKDISGSLTPVPNRSSRLTVLDLSAHYYPYGEARWRPYFKLGIGYTQQSFADNSGRSHRLNACTVPFGFGVKYWWSDRVNVFGEVVDNMIFGSGPTKTQSDWALNFGVHFTFGTNPNYHPTVYWPHTAL